jgi:hypothetical protein
MKIVHTDISRVYSGRSGCMCGCNGNYRENDSSKKNMLTRILKGDYNVDFWKRTDSQGDAGCIYVDTPTRTQVAYFKPGTGIFADDIDQSVLDAEFV